MLFMNKVNVATKGCVIPDSGFLLPFVRDSHNLFSENVDNNLFIYNCVKQEGNGPFLL